MLPIVTANGVEEKKLLSALRSRSGEVDAKVTRTVSEILENVRKNGDRAVEEYTLKFDGKLPPALEVSREEINDALTEADPDFVSTLLNSMENIGFSQPPEAPELSEPQGERSDFRPADPRAETGGTLCSRRHGSVSFFGPDECDPGKNRRCPGADYGHTSYEGRQG